MKVNQPSKEIEAAIKIQRAYRMYAKAQLMKAAAEAIDYTDHLRKARQASLAKPNNMRQSIELTNVMVWNEN